MFPLFLDVPDKDGMEDEPHLLVNSAISHRQPDILHLLHESQSRTIRDSKIQLSSSQMIGAVRGQDTIIDEPADLPIDNESQTPDPVNFRDPKGGHYTPPIIVER